MVRVTATGYAEAATWETSMMMFYFRISVSKVLPHDRRESKKTRPPSDKVGASTKLASEGLMHHGDQLRVSCLENPVALAIRWLWIDSISQPAPIKPFQTPKILVLYS